MKRQRGIADGWLYLIGLIVVLGLVSGIVYGVTSYINGVDAKGYARGRQEVEAAWQEREAKINGEAAARIAAADARVREAERRGAQDVADVRTEYQRLVKGKDNALQIALNSLHAGTGGLFVNAQCPDTAGAAPGGNAPGGTAGAAARADGTRRAELSAADSEFLLTLGSQADTVAIRLGKAQDLIASYYRLCGKPAGR